MEVGNWVIWERFAPVLRGLVEKSKDFRTAKGVFCARLNGEYFQKWANVGYPLQTVTAYGFSGKFCLRGEQLHCEFLRFSSFPRHLVLLPFC